MSGPTYCRRRERGEGCLCKIMRVERDCVDKAPLSELESKIMSLLHCYGHVTGALPGTDVVKHFVAAHDAKIAAEKRRRGIG